MRRTTVAGLALLLTGVLASPAAAAPTGGDWQMNETSGPVTDSLGDNDSVSIGAGISRTSYAGGGRGLYFKGTGIVTVPDSAGLRPGSKDILMEARLRPAGLGDKNVLQKGQFSAAGQMMKLEIVGSGFNCIFKGTGGDQRVGTGSGVQGTAKAGVWQTVQCRKTANRISLVVDGVERAARTVAAGSIGTSGKPVQIGGKINCPIECDYYVGGIDYAKILIGS